MSLAYKLSGNILEVKETRINWTSTQITFWYYDIENWLVSSHGRSNEVPTRPMQQDSIDWVKKHYLPKVKGVTT
jgi:hypothetical protein